jgi:UDP-N-acetylglucosamine 2-epimerase (non-hydrolysing)
MILICYGTRPEWLKIKPLICEFNKCSIKYKTLFTGQHDDIANREADFIESINEKVSDNRLNSILASTISFSEKNFKDVTHVLVQGDTTSALGLALNAFNRKINVIHLEAGLRTYSKSDPYPEEINRQIISRIASIHFCPTKANKSNLLAERCFGKIFVVGNTSLDNIKNVPCCYTDTVLVTLHRRENHAIIQKWFTEIEKLALKYNNIEFILPLHPNPNIKKYRHLLKNINVIEPLEHGELIKLLAKCVTVITDSGGIQEEASFLNKKIIVCRKLTERQESLNVHSFICKTPKDLNRLFSKIIKNPKIDERSPYGNGETSKKIVNIINRYKL